MNERIRKAAKSAGVRHWQIAEALEMTEGTFCRLLRHELSAEEKQKIMEIIQKLSKEAC